MKSSELKIKGFRDLTKEEKLIFKTIILNNYREKNNEELVELINNELKISIKPHSVIWFKSFKGLYYKNDGKFVKGHLSVLSEPIGTIRKRKDKTLIKVSRNKWQVYSRYVYEQHHKVKLGHYDKVIFLNGDTTDFSIDNLEVVNPTEFGIMVNKNYLSSDKNLTRAYLSLVRLELELKKKKKG